MLVKLASRCNLDCGYCYVYRMGDEGWRSQPKKMALDTVAALGRRLADLVGPQGRSLGVVFHGGEPLLVGARRFDEVCRTLRGALPVSCGLALQTNGVLLDDAVVATCVRHDVAVSVSLDGPAPVHDRHRPDRRGRGSHAAAVAGIARLVAGPTSRALFSGVLAVVDLEADPVDVYEFLKATGAPSVDFLYRDGNHEAMPAGKASFASVEYGAWMTGLLDHYLADAAPIKVRILDDMLRLLLGGRAAKEGVRAEAFGILVVETDGTVAKNDTLKAAHPGADRFERPPSIHDVELADLIVGDDYVRYEAGQRPTAGACAACPDFAVCGGGMPAHRWSATRGFDNPSVFCADQRLLAAHMRRKLRRYGIAA